MSSKDCSTECKEEVWGVVNTKRADRLSITVFGVIIVIVLVCAIAKFISYNTNTRKRRGESLTWDPDYHLPKSHYYGKLLQGLVCCSCGSLLVFFICLYHVTPSFYWAYYLMWWLTSFLNSTSFLLLIRFWIQLKLEDNFIFEYSTDIIQAKIKRAEFIIIISLWSIQIILYALSFITYYDKQIASLIVNIDQWYISILDFFVFMTYPLSHLWLRKVFQSRSNDLRNEPVLFDKGSMLIAVWSIGRLWRSADIVSSQLITWQTERYTANTLYTIYICFFYTMETLLPVVLFMVWMLFVHQPQFMIDPSMIRPLLLSSSSNVSSSKIIKAKELKKIEYLKKIGQGTFGDVYTVRYSGKIYAAKQIRVERGYSEDDANFLRKELEVLSSINKHENIIALEYVLLDPYFLLLTEYIPGGTLKDFLYSRSSSSTNILNYMAHLSDIHMEQMISNMIQGLKYLHKNSIIHRDLKSSNIMVRIVDQYNIVLKIIDFGLASIKTQSEPFLSGGGGSRGYVGPERIQGLCYFESDVYALAVVVWELFALRPPPSHGKPSLEVSNLPAYMSQILGWCWEDNPLCRPNIFLMEELLTDWAKRPPEILNRTEILMEYWKRAKSNNQILQATGYITKATMVSDICRSECKETFTDLISYLKSKSELNDEPSVRHLITECNEAINSFPVEYPYYIQAEIQEVIRIRIRSFIKIRNYEKALKDADKLNGSKIEPYVRRGEIYLVKKDYQKALEQFLKAAHSIDRMDSSLSSTPVGSYKSDSFISISPNSIPLSRSSSSVSLPDRSLWESNPWQYLLSLQHQLNSHLNMILSPAVSDPSIV